eukprot:TRINITY_DN3783_c0_g2_i1.p1 TRINITY_DN3783_c0_g2~~TRINITY_DN3783_c0_g2_i1.p1  ORF type:complete len:245 (-),score=35.42 TRINITY_DN3783_c0_g2_i1:342-1076(-)
MCEVYEVVIYTASMEYYGNEILERLDPDRLIAHRLFRSSCSVVRGGLVKNLARLGRDLKNIVIVDNSPSCYALQPCNGIPIKTWTEDASDAELEKLMPILELLTEVNDVRDYLREVVVDNKIDYEYAIRLLKGECAIPRLEFSFDSICSSIERMQSVTEIPAVKELHKQPAPKRAESEILSNIAELEASSSAIELDDMPTVIHIDTEAGLTVKSSGKFFQKIKSNFKNSLFGDKDFSRLSINTR